MIKIYMFMGYGKPDGEIKKGENDLIHLFTFEDKAFMYVETENENFNADNVCSKGLVAYPDGTFWQEMPNVYLTSVPLSREHWARKNETKPCLRINRLKYEKVSSYIFNHYRMQEEKWDHDREKYDAIFILGTTLVYYAEQPRLADEEPYANSLSTQDTPWDTWASLMTEHFKPWEKYDGVWLNCDMII